MNLQVKTGTKLELEFLDGSKVESSVPSVVRVTQTDAIVVIEALTAGHAVLKLMSGLRTLGAAAVTVV